MNNLKIITATKARNNWFEVLNWVNIQRKELWVSKNNKIIVKILPGDQPVIDNIDEIINKTQGMLKGKKTYFPYEDPKIQARERKANNPYVLWKT